MIKKLALFLYLFTSYSYAGYTIDLTDPKNLEVADLFPSYEMLRSINFNDTNSDSTFFGFKTSKSSGKWDTVFIAHIGANKNGVKKIYITLASECSDQKENLGTTTIKTNGQNVKYHRFCNGENIYLTPVSKAGDNFLVNEFTKKNDVTFEFSDIFVLFDATGFTKRWNNFGGDAL